MAHLPWPPHPPEEKSSILVLFHQSTFSIMFASSRLARGKLQTGLLTKTFQQWPRYLWDAWISPQDNCGLILPTEQQISAAASGLPWASWLLNSVVQSTNKIPQDGNMLLAPNPALDISFTLNFYKGCAFFCKTLYMQLFLNAFVSIFSFVFFCAWCFHSLGVKRLQSC